MFINDFIITSCPNAVLCIQSQESNKIPQVPNHQQQKHPTSSHLLWKKHVLLEYSVQSQTERMSTENEKQRFWIIKK